MDRAELVRLLNRVPATGEPRDIVVCEREPEAFMRVFGDAVAAGGTVFLADPNWGETERAQFAALTAAHRTDPASRQSSQTPQERIGSGATTADVAAADVAAANATGRLQEQDGWLCIPTGGSSGAIKLARHDESTIGAAVRGFAEYFGMGRVNAIGLLPLHHVSGLMAWMRCVLTGGDYVPWAWRDLEAGRRPELPAGGVFLSLVPTQLERLLRQPEAVEWLRRFRAVFIGGAPAWPELVERGAEEGLPLAFSYGTTETAAMVVALKPEDFLAGMRGSGRPLPHARVSVGPDSRVAIEAASLFRGYWPGRRVEGPWSSGDLGAFDRDGSLRIHGRADALIISGGEKIDPVEVEAALRGSGRFSDIAVMGVPDAEWGARVVAFYPGAEGIIERSEVERHLEGNLARYKWPKTYVAVKDWPRNAQGKLMREKLRETYR